MNFLSKLERFSDSTAVINSNGEFFSYKYLLDSAKLFSGKLEKNNKKLIFILCDNNIESLIGYLGTLLSDNTGVLLASNIKQEPLDRLIEIYRPDYIWGNFNNDTQDIYNLNDYKLTSYNVNRSISINPELALMLSTSGSTGSPKMVRLTLKNLSSNAESIAGYLDLDKNEKPITSLPMHYSFGLSVINSHLEVGATILLTSDSIITRPFWDFFKKYEATSFSGVPYTYEMLRRFKFFDMSLPSLKTMTQAGGKLTPVFAKEFAEFADRRNLNFYIMYGQTEATARISYLPKEKCLEKYDSMGIAIPGGELSIKYSDNKTITKSNINGELVYKGPNVMLGYAESETDLQDGDKQKGTLYTGDIAYYDDDGFFYITGRLKRFLKIYGNRVNLDEIEHYLKSLGFDCVCGGKDDHLLIAATGESVDENLIKAVQARYGFHHTTIKIFRVDEIPKNSSGKIQYEKVFGAYLN